MSTKNKLIPAMNFKSMHRSDVPEGRNGKHKEVVAKILQDLERLDKGEALKIPLEVLPYSKEKIRSALNRASRKQGLVVATASDAEHLYVWNSDQVK